MQYSQRRPRRTTFRVWFDDGANRFYRYVNEQTSEDACILALEIGDQTNSTPLYPFEIKLGAKWVPYHPYLQGRNPRGKSVEFPEAGA